MMRKKMVSSTEAIQRKIENVLAGEWANHAYMCLKKDAILPDWLTVEATVDGNYPILQGTQSFTSLKTDLCQDINRGFASSRFLNGTFP